MLQRSGELYIKSKNNNNDNLIIIKKIFLPVSHGVLGGVEGIALAVGVNIGVWGRSGPKGKLDCIFRSSIGRRRCPWTQDQTGQCVQNISKQQWRRGGGWGQEEQRWECGSEQVYRQILKGS